MLHYEFEVEMHVRKTLHMQLAESITIKEAKSIMQGIVDGTTGVAVQNFQKWVSGDVYPPHPVETIIQAGAVPVITKVHLVGS